MRNETDLIERIAKSIPSRVGRSSQGLRVGIGDDAAMVRSRPGTEFVLSCDFFLENVHFLSHLHPPDSVGFKALARATSDLAAMGATPRFFLLSLGLPQQRTGKWLDGFLQGMARAAHEYGMHLIGGDTSRYRTVIINLTVLGEVAPSRALLRSGARPGDRIYVSGTLGRAQLGLELILRGLHRKRQWAALTRTHFWPQARLALGQWLSRTRLASAAIDTSDGLSTDLAHICDASGVGAVVLQKRIPAPCVPAALLKRGLDPLALALHGGDDYELLFTVPRGYRRKIPASYQGVPLTEIGEVTRGKDVRLQVSSGRSVKLTPRGWDSFRKK